MRSLNQCEALRSVRYISRCLLVLLLCLNFVLLFRCSHRLHADATRDTDADTTADSKRELETGYTARKKVWNVVEVPQLLARNIGNDLRSVRFVSYFRSANFFFSFSSPIFFSVHFALLSASFLMVLWPENVRATCSVLFTFQMEIVLLSAASMCVCNIRRRYELLLLLLLLSCLQNAFCYFG